MQTRPLALKGADNKIICGVVNNKIKHYISEQAHQAQRGFLPRRNFIEHIVQLDGAARRFSSAPL